MSRAFLLPKPLRDGGTIGIISPASPPSTPAKIDRGIAYLERRGYTVVRGAHLYDADGYLAGSDSDRADDLNAMFANTSVDAIFCSRGGSGTGRLLPLIDYPLIQRNPKVFVGYSDITTISMALWSRCSLVTYAGPMVAADMQAEMPRETEQQFWAMMKGVSDSTIIPASGGIPALSPGIAEGTLLGGTLSVLATLLGTPYEPLWDGCILFIEDVGENVYKIDRLLTHFRNAGVLHRIAGMVLGAFTGIPDDTINRRLDVVLNEILLPLNIPVIQGFPFGHIPTKVTLPYGTPAFLDANTGTLTLRPPFASAP